MYIMRLKQRSVRKCLVFYQASNITLSYRDASVKDSKTLFDNEISSLPLSFFSSSELAGEAVVINSALSSSHQNQNPSNI